MDYEPQLNAQRIEISNLTLNDIGKIDREAANGLVNSHKVFQIKVKDHCYAGCTWISDEAKEKGEKHLSDMIPKHRELFSEILADVQSAHTLVGHCMRDMH